MKTEAENIAARAVGRCRRVTGPGHVTEPGHACEDCIRRQIDEELTRMAGQVRAIVADWLRE